MKSLVICILLTFTISLLAQQEKAIEQQLDSIFVQWNKPQTLGVAAGVIYKDELMYLKGFGTANLEYDIPITPQTKFQIDHLSKQFTTLAILVLEEQGKIKLTDDIRTYVPQLPEYAAVITIANVLNHSTGLNNYSLVKSLVGKTDTMGFTQADALALISTQKTLNFKPGTVFSYLTSDPENTLLVEIITKVSGQSFASFVKANIFDALQMKNTLFCDDVEMLISNKAASYRETESGNKRNELRISNHGATNLYISAEDLSIWYQRFNKKQSDLHALIKKLDTPVKLSTGKTYDSSWGKMTWGRSFYHLERGTPAYWQYGIIGGYAANVFRFPEQELISFVIGNNMRYNGSPAMQAAEFFMKDAYLYPPVIDFNTLKIINLSSKKLKEFEGDYWDGKRGLGRKITVKQDTLRFSSLGSDYESALLPLSATKFQMVVESGDIIILDFKEEENRKLVEIVVGQSNPGLYKAYTPMTYKEEELKEFIGAFQNRKLNSAFDFKVENGLLIAKNSNSIGNHVEFFPVKTDVFRSNELFLGSIAFMRDTDNSVTGFTITTDGITNLEFKKEEVL